MTNDFISAPIGEVKEAEEKPSLTYKLDLEKGRIAGKIDNLEAVNQAIKKALITPRFKLLIYDTQYGSEIESAITAKDASQYYANAVLESFVKDALNADTRILEIYDFTVAFEEDNAFIAFKVDTIFGNTNIEVVI